MHSILPADKNPALHKKSKLLSHAEIGSVQIRHLIARMKKLLAKEQYGVALAAVQIGEPVRPEERPEGVRQRDIRSGSL